MSRRTVVVHAQLRYDSATLEDAQMVMAALLGQLHVEAEKISADPLWDTLIVKTEEYQEESRAICDAGNIPIDWKMLHASVQSTREGKLPATSPAPVIDHWMDYQ